MTRLKQRAAVAVNWPCRRQRTYLAGDRLCIVPPADPGVLQQASQVQMSVQAMLARRSIVVYSISLPTFHPQIVRQAGMDTVRIEVVIRNRRHGNQRSIDV